MGLGEFGPWHLLIVAVVFVLLFGSRKLPDAARSLGRSLRIFKAEIHGLRDDPPGDSPTTPAVTGDSPQTGTTSKDGQPVGIHPQAEASSGGS
ncbi:Sec-independent protein translocase subunit TatA [Frankia sp. Cppng1_Ct_nod]|uniref:Sec-independent protein translocase subunit TatA n=1 Tax=Frankia sp. Cppng1_Ct_nod TaxID=2897162 RepID=UPI001A942493|nr:Sec-independent protein translocase subunit TatA [Frankia sp. Cppng1_Ct_nod]